MVANELHSTGGAK